MRFSDSRYVVTSITWRVWGRLPAPHRILPTPTNNTALAILTALTPRAVFRTGSFSRRVEDRGDSHDLVAVNWVRSTASQMAFSDSRLAVSLAVAGRRNCRRMQPEPRSQTIAS